MVRPHIVHKESLCFATMRTLALSLLLLLHSAAAVTPRCNPDDKKVLLEMESHFHLNPSPGSCCAWNYVGCDPTGRVGSLQLLNFNASGTIPDALGDLTALSFLDFHKINLTGPIPRSFANLTNLLFLRLDWNQLSGPIPDIFANFHSLTHLDLSFNKLSGSIPASLAKPPRLISIDLSRNHLTGGIPSELAASSSGWVHLSHNLLSGPIPASFANSRVEDFDVSRNQLTGDASVLFGASSRVRTLDLSRNSFEFDLTRVEFPENMLSLDLNHNEVFGGIPKEITRMELLQSFNVSYNRLCGEIPSGGGLARFDEYSFFHNKCLCGAPLAECKAAELGRKL